METKAFIQSYIDQCDSIIESRDEKEAGRLVAKIINVFGNDIPNIRKGLTRSGAQILDSSGTVSRLAGARWNNLKDLEMLRERLKYELAKLLKTEDIKDSKITVINHGNEVSLQIQQDVNQSTQINQVDCNINFEEAQKVIDELNSYRAYFKDEFGEHCQKLEQALEAASNAINKKEERMLQKAWSTIKSILENTLGSAIATTMLATLEQIPGLM